MKSIIKNIVGPLCAMLAIIYTIYTVDAYLENETNAIIYNAFIATLNYIAVCVDLIIDTIKNKKSS